jgi:cytoskeletal protein CcmA (bactofilin family)
MFSSKSKSTVISSENTTLIAKGTEISGQISFTGCLEIEGVIRGNIVVEAGCEVSQVRIQNSGAVHGDVCAPIVIVNGNIEGNVYSSKRVEMAANAVVCGDVHYQMMAACSTLKIRQIRLQPVALKKPKLLILMRFLMSMLIPA